MEATAKGSLDMVVLLVGKGADVNARDTTTGDTPLSIASGGRNNLIHGSPVVAQSLPIVCYLLAHHAAVDAPDTEGITPLMVAANRGETDVVHVLIENKASVNLRDNSGQTALMKAVLTNFVVPPQRRVQTVEELIVGGTDVRLRDIKGRNAAAIAIQDGLSEIVPLLAR